MALYSFVMFARWAPLVAVGAGGRMTTESERIANTLAYLRKCQTARAAGYPVSLVTDPSWLVEQAINRRAGWVEDPHTRGSSPPIACGHGSSRRAPLYRKARGDWQRHLRLIAHEINTPRLVVRPERLGEHRWLVERLPHRFG